jgi:hypothetical protein
MHMVATCNPTSCSIPKTFRTNKLNRVLSHKRNECSVDALPPHPKQNLGIIFMGGGQLNKVGRNSEILLGGGRL